MESFLQGSFAIAVAAFLLLRMENELKKLRAAIETLRHCQTCTASPWRIELEGAEDDNP